MAEWGLKALTRCADLNATMDPGSIIVIIIIIIIIIIIMSSISMPATIYIIFIIIILSENKYLDLDSGRWADKIMVGWHQNNQIRSSNNYQQSPHHRH